MDAGHTYDGAGTSHGDGEGEGEGVVGAVGAAGEDVVGVQAAAAAAAAGIRGVVSYQNCDPSSVLTVMSIWPNAIPRSDPFDYAIAIKAFASTNPPHPNRSVECSGCSSA